MQIFYIVAVVAVFVLCVALLSTARRILRSSPLASGELGIGRIYDADPDVDRSDEDREEEFHSETKLSGMEAEHEERDSRAYEVAEREPEPARANWSQREVHAEVFQSVSTAPLPVAPVGEVAPEAMDFDSFEAAYMHAAEEQETGKRMFFGREKIGGFHLPRPTRKTYQCALECLLLGVSAYVLIKTQQSNIKMRSQQALPQSSQKGRVA